MNFLQAYDKAHENTEPPKNFHLWTALSCVSALLGRKVYLPFGHYEIFPQLYVVLVGDAGSKKTTAMNQGRKLLRKLKGFPLGPTAITREALSQRLKRHKMKYFIGNQELFYHQVAAFNTELGEFIGRAHTNASMVSIMVALWDDNPYENETKNSGTDYIENPYFSLLTCTQPFWLRTNMKGSIISEGFSRRVIFVYETKREKYIPRPYLDTNKSNGLKELAVEATRISKMFGVARFTEESGAMFDKMYVELQEEIPFKDRNMQSYYGARHDLLQKVSICLSAVLRDDLVIDTKILDIADRMLKDTEVKFESLINGVGRNELSTYKDEANHYIQMRGKVSLAELLEKFTKDLKAQEFNEVMSTLIDTKQVALHGSEYVSLHPITHIKKTNLFDLVRDYEIPREETPCGSKDIEFNRLQL